MNRTKSAKVPKGSAHNQEKKRRQSMDELLGGEMRRRAAMGGLGNLTPVEKAFLEDRNYGPSAVEALQRARAANIRRYPSKKKRKKLGLEA